MLSVLSHASSPGVLLCSCPSLESRESVVVEKLLLIDSDKIICVRVGLRKEGPCIWRIDPHELLVYILLNVVLFSLCVRVSGFFSCVCILLFSFSTMTYYVCVSFCFPLNTIMLRWYVLFECWFVCCLILIEHHSRYRYTFLAGGVYNLLYFYLHTPCSLSC